MQFVHNEQVNVLNVLSLFPTPTKDIPKLWDTNNNAALIGGREGGRGRRGKGREGEERERERVGGGGEGKGGRVEEIR